MKRTRRELLRLLASSPAAGLLTATHTLAQETPPDNPILRAMTDELARSRQLRVLSGKDPLYYLEYSLDDAESYAVAATLGALLNERRNRFRIPRVSARIGSPEFDNTNYVFSDYYFGSRFDPEQFSLDDDYQALRHAFWLATDRAFKGAIEAIGRKRAALRNLTQAEKLPDFGAAPALKKILPVRRVKVDDATWKQRVVSLSSIFSAYPDVFESTVEFDVIQSASYFANSDGTAAVLPDFLYSLRVRAVGQAADGMRLRDHAALHSVDLPHFPVETDLRRAVTAVADNIRALTAAPAGEQYSGPVLFEASAAAQLFAELLGGALPATRKPVIEPGRPAAINTGIFEGRIGSRVLPASFTVVDDPTQAEWHGRALLGTYPIDGEGVAPEPLTVVEKGMLKTLLSTRQPSKDVPLSNGRARLPGMFGAKAAAISNLFVKSAEGVPAAELRAQLLKLVADRNKPYGIIIRKMDFPSTASLQEIRRIATGHDRPASLPVLAYRVYPDGREELVRGLRFRGLNARALKDVLAASTDEFAFDFLGNLAPFSAVSGSNYVYPSTVVAPSVLFEDLELERLDQDLPKRPIVPIPPSGAE